MKTALPANLLSLMRHWGARWHDDILAGRDAMVAAWTPWVEQAAASQPAMVVQSDLPYGDSPRQVLDVVAPLGAQDLPVLIYVHGGAFVRGEKVESPWLWGNVPLEFARHGFVACNVEYRLAPQAPWPEGAADVRDAVLWMADNAVRLGGDPRRIVLMGHSAGCAHCATAVWDDRVRPAGGLPLAGLALISPRLVADVRPENPNAHGVRAYYGDDASAYADRGPQAHVRSDAPPTLVAMAQFENPLLDFYAFDLAHRLAQQADRHRGPKPRMLQLLDHNHVSIVAQFNTAFNALGGEIRDWIERVERGEYAAVDSSGR